MGRSRWTHIPFILVVTASLIGLSEAQAIPARGSARGCDPTYRKVPAPDPGFDGTNLTDIAAINARDAWTVGFADGTLSLHWDGSTWSEVHLPSQNAGDALEGVAAVASDDVWAVGASEFTGTPSPLIFHWNGTRWSLVPAPIVPPGTLLYSVTAAAQDDVWAVGASGLFADPTPLVLHWDGSAWTVVPTPVLPEAALLRSVDAIAPDDVWAVGYETSELITSTLAEHWDGRSWSVIPTGAGMISGFNGVAGDATDEVWAVGWKGRKPLAARWDGSSWRVGFAPSLGVFNMFMHVAVAGPGDFVAVGHFYDGNVDKALVEEWAGSGWHVAPAKKPDTMSDLNAVAVSSFLRWAVGTHQNGSDGDHPHSLIERACVPAGP